MIMPLNIFAHLSLTSGDGREISVSADGAILTVKMPGFWVSRSLLKERFSTRKQREQALSKLHDGLFGADVTLEVWMANRLVARLRPQSRPNFWSRLLGYGAVELKIIPILLSLARP